MPWGRLSLWKWVPEISPGVKAAGAFGWRTAILVVPNVKKIRGLNLPGTPWATSACCGMTFTLYHYCIRCVLISFVQVILRTAFNKFQSTESVARNLKHEEHAFARKVKVPFSLSVNLTISQKRFSLLSLGPVTIFLWRTYSYFVLCCSNSGLGRLVFEVTRSQAIRHTPGKTPLNKWSVRSTGSYLHNTK